jgi:hypothetical protein
MLQSDCNPKWRHMGFWLVFSPKHELHLRSGRGWLSHIVLLAVMSWSRNTVDDLETISNSEHINVTYVRYPALDTEDRHQSLTVHTTLSRGFNSNTSRCNLFQNKFILPKMPEIFYLLPNAWSNISSSHENAMNVKVIIMNQRRKETCPQPYSLGTVIKWTN